ncbi:nicastrin isoform X2 [Phymastichus coffea]|uniref:nicastrin isoform X2 n=1 Tax=Phymastichus coffea TaxID=108790 RepID=UPI00273CF022|nr:nicastrin isoform X2 [Phymastichus coffea]
MKDLLRICLGFMAIASCSYSVVSANRIKDILYMPIDTAAACFRRHNGTHQFGCSSSRSGSIGVIHYVENDIDIEWLEKNGTAGPYTIVLSFDMYTKSNLRRFKKSNNINGVLLTRNTSLEHPYRYSPDDTCPNRYSGSKSCDHEWNPYGSSLLLEDWPFPMFYTQDGDTLNKIRECYSKYNAHDREKQAERSLCALEMKSFMLAAVNAETCIRRSNSGMNFNPNIFCDPIGDRNIHWPAGPMSDSVKYVIMVIARLDSNSLFENLIPGAGSAVTGLVTLLAAATYLHHLNVTVNDTNIVFSLLNGESMDYIGSSRLAHDLIFEKFDALGGKFLHFDQISSIIELGQLGEGDIYLHTNNSNNNPIIVNLQNLRKELNATFMDNSVPPASVQSFLKRDSNMPVVVITNHGRNFTNKYYNGLLDDAEGLGYSRNGSERLTASLARVASKLGEELYRIATKGKTPPSNYTFVEELVGELLPCYLVSARCPLFRAASPVGAKLPNQVFPMYTSVVKNDMVWTTLTGQLLALLTGEHFPHLNTSAVCVEKHLLWMAGYNFSGACINATANFSLAVSPAFDIVDYDMKTGYYPTWTESVWLDLSMRMLLKAPPAQERLSLIIGSTVAILSFILVWFVKSRSHVLFNTGSVDL